MNFFYFLVLMSGLGAIGAFVFGARAMAVNGGSQQQCGSSAGWTWHSVFTFFVFVTILAAPLSR